VEEEVFDRGPGKLLDRKSMRRSGNLFFLKHVPKYGGSNWMGAPKASLLRKITLCGWVVDRGGRMKSRSLAITLPGKKKGVTNP